MKKSRPIKKSVYILTEGDTEEAFFSRISEIVGVDTEWRYSVRVEVREIVSGSSTDPVNMVKEAKRSKNKYDEIWVVFDRDRQRDVQNEQAIDLANKLKIRVAFSSISFEHWLILYFERNIYAFQRSDCESRSTNKQPIKCICGGKICACSYLKQPNLYPKFRKGYALLYDDLQHRNINAIENAAWLRSQLSTSSQIHLLNPYTDVDVLLCELLDLQGVQYFSLKQSFKAQNMSILVSGYIRNGSELILQLDLTNSGNTAIAINNLLPINVIDENQEIYTISHVEVGLLEPGVKLSTDLHFSINPNSQVLKLKIQNGHKYVLVDLQ